MSISETPTGSPQSAKFKKPKIALPEIRTRIARRLAEQGILDPRRRAALREQHPDLARLDDAIGELHFPIHIVEGLTEAEIEHVYQLLLCTREEILAIPRFGEEALDTILTVLHDAGFTVKNWTPPQDRTDAPSSALPAPPPSMEDPATKNRGIFEN